MRNALFNNVLLWMMIVAILEYMETLAKIAVHCARAYTCTYVRESLIPNYLPAKETKGGRKRGVLG